MKTLSIIAISFLLFCCKSESIKPDAITSFEYGTLFGLGGGITRLMVYPQKQTYQLNVYSDKTCETAISASEWNQLTQLFSEKAFRKIKPGEKSPCADASAMWVIVRSSDKELKAGQDDCTGTDITPIQPLVDALQKREQAMIAVCK